jgi:hypothetical protein
MSASNPKKPAPLHSGYEWAGTVARFQRGARSSRGGRSALLGILTSVYANAARSGDARNGSERS